jgi:hypothetical protein
VSMQARSAFLRGGCLTSSIQKAMVLFERKHSKIKSMPEHDVALLFAALRLSMSCKSTKQTHHFFPIAKLLLHTPYTQERSLIFCAARPQKHH